jgi:hypothetical protein
MRRLKKKDLKAPKLNKVDNSEENIEELVDVDGSPIEGDRNAVADSEIEVPAGQTTDDYAQSAIQPSNQFNGLYGTPYSRGVHNVRLESERRAKAILSRILKENNNK